MAQPRVLLIEDEGDQIHLVQTRLEASGFEVFCAVDGEEGLRKAAELIPNLILLDVRIPKLDGFELCQRLRQQDQTREIPVIVFTAMGMRDLGERCKAVGANAWIQKPYESQELIAQIWALIHSGTEQESAPRGVLDGVRGGHL